MNNKRFLVFVLAVAALGLAFIASTMVGGSELAFSKAAYYLFHPNSAGVGRDIVWQIRVPRIILGLLVGAGLASCGVVFQGLLRNPLAEPYTLGVSGGAALGATLGIILTVSGACLAAFAFAGGALNTFLIYAVASRKRFSNSALILSGVMLSFVFSSLVFLILSFSRAENIHGVVLWLMGDLSSARINLVKIMPLFIFPAMGLILVFSRDLDILTLGDEKAVHLGVNPERVKRTLFIAASCITGACVAAAGMIGFVGLVIPHLMRRLVGVNHRLLLLASCAGGAVFLVLCDTLARVIVRPLELPVGVITGIFGGIFFLIFILRSKHWELF